jgi:hypothetical protein
MQHGKCSFQSLQTSRSAVMRNMFEKALILLHLVSGPSPAILTLVLERALREQG